MSKRKIGSVKWSMMFKIDTCKRTRDEMWEILHKFDREMPDGFCEWATDDWYTWHSFSTLKSLERALPLVFEAFPETKEINVYKDVERGNYANGFFRKTVTREEIIMAKGTKNTLTKAMAMTLCPIIKEIFRLDTDGWACGLTVCNELFEGSIYDLTHAFFTYDSPKNREFVEYLWGGESFAREVKV